MSLEIYSNGNYTCKDKNNALKSPNLSTDTSLLFKKIKSVEAAFNIFMLNGVAFAAIRDGGFCCQISSCRICIFDFCVVSLQ